MKTEEFRTLDINIHHGRYVPADNVVKISTEKFEYTTPCDKDRRLYIYHICNAIVRAVDEEMGEFTEIIITFSKKGVKASCYNDTGTSYSKVFCIEIKEAPIS
jgi:hypothetical protein